MRSKLARKTGHEIWEKSKKNEVSTTTHASRIRMRRVSPDWIETSVNSTRRGTTEWCCGLRSASNPTSSGQSCLDRSGLIDLSRAGRVDDRTLESSYVDSKDRVVRCSWIVAELWRVQFRDTPAPTDRSGQVAAGVGWWLGGWGGRQVGGGGWGSGGCGTSPWLSREL